MNIPLKTNKPRVDIYLHSPADRTSGKGDVLGNRLFCSSWKNITKFVVYIVAKEGQHLLLVRNLLNIVLLCSQSSLVRDIRKALLRHFIPLHTLFCALEIMDTKLYQSERMVDDRTKALVQQSSDVVLATHVEPTQDMITERNRASFDTKGLAEYLNGGKEKLQRLYAPRVPISLCPACHWLSCN